MSEQINPPCSFCGQPTGSVCAQCGKPVHVSKEDCVKGHWETAHRPRGGS